jgi:hypothetical protein
MSNDARGAPNPLQPDVLEFLAVHIARVEDLDILLALLDGGDRWWDVESMGNHVGVSRGDAHRCLERFAGRNLLDIRFSETIRYQLRPGSPEVEERLHSFAAAYRRSPAAIIRYVVGRTYRNVSDFADSFRFWRRR